MSALDEIILSKKYGQSYTPLESVLMVHKKRYPNDAESAAAELLALRSDLADAKARAKTAEENWHKNEARVGRFQMLLDSMMEEMTERHRLEIETFLKGVA